MTELAEELVKHGHELTVVTAFPHYAGNVLDEDYRGKLIQREERPGMRILRTYLYTSPKKDRFWVRFLNYVSFNVLSTLVGIFSGPQDVILAPSPPLTIGLSAYIIGLLKRIPYVYNVQDINPDVLIKLGILTNPLGIAFSRWLERFVYRQADHITVLSEGFRKNLLAKGVPAKKLTVIPNFIDVDFVCPLPTDNRFREQFDLKGKFVVLYAGNLGHSQNLEHALQAAALLEEEKEIMLVIVGDGSRKPHLQALAEEMGVSNVQFFSFQPREMVPLIYAAADVSLVTLKKDIALDSVPSKAYTIMASGRPILAAVDPGSDAWGLVETANAGICVEPENPAALADAIETFHQQPELRERLGQHGRDYVVAHYTRQVIGQRYHQFLTDLVSKSGNRI
jgi:colanic acid biosynthesis glycosyl transferase WcaI